MKNLFLMSLRNLQGLSLFLLVCSTQFSYLLPLGGAISVIFAIFLFAIVITKERIIESSAELLFLILFSLMAALGLLLLLFNSPGPLEPRSIFRNNLLQIVVVCLTIMLGRSKKGINTISLVYIAAIVFESLLIFGQFSYITYGIGFSKIALNEYDLAYITGSHPNPNDAAAQLGLLALAVSAYYVLERKTANAYLLLASILPGLFFTLSRTMIIFWVLNLICIYASSTPQKSQTKYYSKIRKLIILLIAGVSLFEAYLQISDAESDVLFRSIQRIETLTDLKNDESTEFRVVSHLRLIENIQNLGFGTFSDLNYSFFANRSEDYLMTVNPHSYIVEYSFLFGYLGFFLILSIFLIFSYFLLFKSSAPRGFRIISVFSIFFIQAVPSSLLTSFYLFSPYIFLWKMRR